MFILVRLLCRRGRASQKLAHALRNPFDAAMIGICAAFRIGNALVNERKYPNIVELLFLPTGWRSNRTAGL